MPLAVFQPVQAHEWSSRSWHSLRKCRALLALWVANEFCSVCRVSRVSVPVLAAGRREAASENARDVPSRPAGRPGGGLIPPIVGQLPAAERLRLRAGRVGRGQPPSAARCRAGGVDAARAALRPGLAAADGRRVRAGPVPAEGRRAHGSRRLPALVRAAAVQRPDARRRVDRARRVRRSSSSSRRKPSTSSASRRSRTSWARSARPTSPRPTPSDSTCSWTTSTRRHERFTEDPLWPTPGSRTSLTSSRTEPSFRTYRVRHGGSWSTWAPSSLLRRLRQASRVARGRGAEGAPGGSPAKGRSFTGLTRTTASLGSARGVGTTGSSPTGGAPLGTARPPTGSTDRVISRLRAIFRRCSSRTSTSPWVRS